MLRRMRWAGLASHMGRLRTAYKILEGKPHEAKRPLGRPRLMWEDNNRTDLREIWWEDVDWIHMAQDRDQWRDLVNTAMKFRVP